MAEAPRAGRGDCGAEKGLRVTVADGGHPPIDKACGEGLLPETLEALDNLGVRLTEADGFALRGIRFLGDNVETSAAFPGGQGIGLRRRVLHQKLVERAQAVGVTLRWNSPATGIAGKRVQLGGGSVEADWIVGADGLHSRVRHWAGLNAGPKPESRYAFRRHYRVRPWSTLMEVHWGERVQAYVTPVSGEEVCVVLISRKRGLRMDSLTREFPGLAEKLREAQPASVERGAITTMRRLRRVTSGAVALIGDASGSVDAITGEGLCLNFHQARALAEALVDGDLEKHERAHRRLGIRPTFMGRALLMLDGRSAPRRRVMRALAADPKVFAGLLAIHVGAGNNKELARASLRLGWRLLAA